MDVKQLERVDEDGLEQWRPVMKAAFPLSASEVVAVLEALGAAAGGLQRERRTRSMSSSPRSCAGNADLLAVRVHKRRARYTVGGCMAELTELRTEHGATRTIAVESEDPARVIAAVRELGLDARHNVSVPARAQGAGSASARGATR